MTTFGVHACLPDALAVQRSGRMACGSEPATYLRSTIPAAGNLCMSDLSAFPITARWPAQYPDRLQLYSLPTPNGVKASIMLEEIGLPYEVHLIDIMNNESWTPEFLSLNPNGKIPAIIDPDGPGGKPIALFESGAILIYLADKTGQLLPADPATRYEAIQWLFFQNAA